MRAPLDHSLIASKRLNIVLLVFPIPSEKYPLDLEIVGLEINVQPFSTRFDDCSPREHYAGNPNDANPVPD